MEIVKNYREVEELPVEVQGSKNAFIRWLIKGPNFILRYFRIKKGGNSPLHSHPYEHEVFVLNGKGRIKLNEKEYEFEKDYIILVPENILHQFVNIGDDDLEFLCIIPNLEKNK